jgi:hypothetical protein
MNVNRTANEFFLVWIEVDEITREKSGNKFIAWLK